MDEQTDINDFLRFRRMITPVIIEVIFWLGVLVAILSALGMVVAGIAAKSISGALIGVVMLVLGPVYIRIMCELTIIFFRMNETLTDIKNSVGPSEQG